MGAPSPRMWEGVRVHPLDTASASQDVLLNARNNSPVTTSQMTPDLASLIQLVAFTAVWELLFRVLQSGARRWGGTIKDRDTAYFVDVLLPSHGVSTLHAVYMSW